jgi:predicted transposase/invertase (TIGR01784 family)
MSATTSWEEKGIEKGMKQARVEIAFKLLRRRVPLEIIAEVTGLTIAQLQQLPAPIEQN